MSGNHPKDINHRSRKILQAVVSEFLNTGEAVGSRTVTRRHGIDLSAATVRNVMADLEEMGFLEQPHTSAGRVPSSNGLRFFIDSLLKVRSLSPKEKEQIREKSGVGNVDVDEVLQRTSKLLSEITHYAGIVLAPHPEQRRLRHLEFVQLPGNRFLCVLVTSEGLIDNKLIEAGGPIDATTLERIHNYLNGMLSGLTLEEMRERVLREIGDQKNQYDAMVGSALALSKAALADTGTAEVFVSGGANLLDSARLGDEDELERMRGLLRALEEKERLLDLLDRAKDSERIRVFLGAETEHSALSDSSVVVKKYGPKDQPLGAIAVIGPTRMNYGKVMSVVDFTAALVSRMLVDGS